VSNLKLKLVGDDFGVVTANVNPRAFAQEIVLLSEVYILGILYVVSAVVTRLSYVSPQTALVL
jgi:hypothetical protein